MREAFDVTQGDIDKGEPFDATNCPVGRCIKRTLRLSDKQAEGLLVDVSTLEYADPDCDVILATFPKSVVDFLADFDNDITVKPFSFTLNINKSCADKAGIELP